jgi:cyclase
VIREIGPHVWIETSYLGANVAAVGTGQGVILVDTPMLPNEARAWRGALEKLTDEPIAYILCTDHHRGHILGNQFFPEATVVAHEGAWREIGSYGDSFRIRLLNMYRIRRPDAVQEWEAGLVIVPPEVTFEGRMSLFCGDKEIHMLHVGGHTPATSVVYVPQDGILFTGDAVVTDRPPFLSQGDTKQWLHALTYLRKLRYEVLVPGHGEPTGKEATERMSEYLRLVRRRVRSAYLHGMGKTETARSLTDLLAFWPIPPDEKPKADRRFKSGVGRVWNEMRAEYGDRKR